MKSDAERFSKLIEYEFDNNRKACAIELKLSESTISRILNGKARVGGKTLVSIIKYCNNKGIDYLEYTLFKN